MSNQFIVRDTDRGNERPVESRAEAEEVKKELEELGATVEIIPPGSVQENPPHDNHGEPVETGTDGGTEIVEHATDESGTQTDEPPQTPATPETDKPLGDALAEIGDSIESDPLDVLPGYMITHVEGKPSLNKRGVSVLAYHYDVNVLEREVVAYPHEHDYQTAVVEIMVENGDGRQFSGIGEAHVDETPKHQLLRMAETRAYKRAVIFATGTGIVGYQELMEELE